MRIKFYLNNAAGFNSQLGAPGAIGAGPLQPELFFGNAACLPLNATTRMPFHIYGANA